ncbi:MAG: phosphoenolpyruvate--protein phosphotransferase [Planctomycetes bacterium]|nr:phosphoenolpyruvate--protein phosphotransferase [Planctomycetota bacterium]
MRKGTPLAPGVAVARAYCVDQNPGACSPSPLDSTDVPAEVARFQDACAAAGQELDANIARVAEQLGESQAAIFRAHRLLLQDPALVGKVQAAIRERRLDACAALGEVQGEYSRMFSQIQDQYLKERLADLRDVIGLILKHLSNPDNAPPPFGPEEPVILVVSEIRPSHLLLVERFRVTGILTEKGGITGHAAILARSLGVPTISGLPGLLREVHTGDRIALDAREGHVFINPGYEVEVVYRRLERDYAAWHDRLAENRDVEPVTADGHPVELLANVNSPAEAELAARVGAAGVGLYRTEYLFLTYPGVPGEEEQLEAYRAVLAAAPHHSAVIRTLDVGADKQIPYLGRVDEPNPSLGWRSTRLLSAHPEFFRTHLRAILRAGCSGTVSLLLPMISLLEEIQAVKKLIGSVRQVLVEAGEPCAGQVAVGIMLEVPAAAACIDELLDEVDFVSIGTNDLTQYLMAADRNNPQVASLCEPFSPPLWRVLSRVIRTCTEHGKPVAVCGEMAGRPSCFLPLFGLGLRQFSMSPALVPSVKELVRRATLPLAQQVAERVVKMKTVAEIRDYLIDQTRQLWPEVSWVDLGSRRRERPQAPAKGK